VYIADFGNNTVDRISPDAPVNTAPIVITGTTTVGQTLTTTTGGWSPEPTSYAYQWQDCDQTGNSCTAIAGATASTYTLDGIDAGHTIRVDVTATNESGVTSALSGQTGIVQAAEATPTSTTSATPTTPTTTTGTTSTTPAAGTSGDGVGITAQAASAGVSVSGRGGVRLPLVCPQNTSGCDADGTLALALGAPRTRAAGLQADATVVRSSVIARFTGVMIKAGHGRLVAVTLSPAAIRYLQTRGIHRVRVTLTIHNHLSGGPSVTTVVRLWLNIAPLQASCPSASGRLTASHIGTMGLGLTRAQAHRLGRYRRTANNFERYCLSAGKIRVAYPAAGLNRRLTANQGRQVNRRVIFALTANRHYAIHGIRVRMSVLTARGRLALGRGIVVGQNTWYFVEDHHATWVLKAQHGIIREIGITQRLLARTRAQQTYLLRHL
jgi:hypothetical protein